MSTGSILSKSDSPLVFSLIDDGLTASELNTAVRQNLLRMGAEGQRAR